MFSTWGNMGNIVGFVGMMREHGLTPDEVLSLYAEWIAEQRRNMMPATPEYAAMVAERRAETLGGIETGPDEDLVGPCPRCGRPVIGHELRCRIVSPVWRTQMACSDVDGCGWHAVSRHDPRRLRRLGLRGNVENEGVA